MRWVWWGLAIFYGVLGVFQGEPTWSAMAIACYAMAELRHHQHKTGER